MEWVAIGISIVAALMGGGGLLSWSQYRRQAGRENVKDYFDSFDKQIELAEKRQDWPEVTQLRLQYEEGLMAWRAQLNVESLALHDIDSRVGVLSYEETAKLRETLARSVNIPQAVVSAEGHFLRGNAYHEIGQYDLAVKEYLQSLRLNPSEEPKYDRNMRMWVQAVRRLPEPPSIESVIDKVAYWQANTGSVDATYYLYVLYAVQVLEGSLLDRDFANRYLEECRNKTRFRRNRTKSFEWVGPGAGLAKLVYHSRLGEWERPSAFWTHTELLTRVTGRIVSIQGMEAGQVEVSGGMSAFFVPARGGFARGRFENQAVDFYLSFSYDGLRAWGVKIV